MRTRFVATGQTGIMIEGWGIAVDAVVADFIAGAAERLVLEGRDADVVLVEGQGSINHPGYSGVTLGLLHGSCPDALILCHQSSREYIGDYRQAAWLRIPPLTEYIRLYETIGSAVHPTKVIGDLAQHLRLTDAEARRACEEAARETGLPATDPVRFDPAPLVDAVIARGRARSGALAWLRREGGAADRRPARDEMTGSGARSRPIGPCSTGALSAFPLPSPFRCFAGLGTSRRPLGRLGRGCRRPMRLRAARSSCSRAPISAPAPPVRPDRGPARGAPSSLPGPTG